MCENKFSFFYGAKYAKTVGYPSLIQNDFSSNGVISRRMLFPIKQYTKKRLLVILSGVNSDCLRSKPACI